MELDEETLDATWTKDENGRPEFFIINEALLSKLCILGDEMEPCFEGSQITAFSLVVDESFQNKLFTMINELKELITEGGKKMFNTYAVEIGDGLWSALWRYLADTYPDPECKYCSIYGIEGIYEDGGKKFAILKDADKYYRLDFELSEESGFAPVETLTEVEKTFTPRETPQFAPEAVEAYKAEYINSMTEGNSDESNTNDSEESTEQVPTYSLEEIPEYVELNTRFAEATAKIEELTNQIATFAANAEAMSTELSQLREFKNDILKKEKEAMIAKFYMLSDEDKKDVIDNIDTYSLDDIEAKLSVICVRNKVSFALDDESAEDETTFNLDGADGADNATPAWVQAALEVANNMNN